MGNMAKNLPIPSRLPLFSFQALSHMGLRPLHRHYAIRVSKELGGWKEGREGRQKDGIAEEKASSLDELASTLDPDFPSYPRVLL